MANPTTTPVSQSEQNPTPPATSSRKMMYLLVGGILLLVFALVVVFATQHFSNSPKSPISQTSPTPITPSTSISGVIDFNGVAPTNSIIAIAARAVGQQSFSVVATNVPAQDGATWKFINATAGTDYELQAYIEVNGVIQAKSQTQIVEAPSTTAILRINEVTKPAQQTANAVISGTLNLNGYIPPNSTIAIQSINPDGTQSIIAQNISAVDNGSFSIPNLISGKTYDLQALLMIHGASVNNSPFVQITAPAANESFAINSTQQPPQPQVVGISGTFSINGPIPSGSYLTIGVRNTGTTNFTQVAGNITAANAAIWSYQSAQSGTSYDIQGYLWSNGTPYSQSQIITVEAPASNELLVINAQPTTAAAPAAGSLTYTCLGKNSSGLAQASINYNLNNPSANAATFWLTVGSSSGDSSLVSAITTPSSPNAVQSYTTNFLFLPNVTYYAQYAYATCLNCSNFSPFSPPLQISCQ